jgi:hypothetical protein
MRGERMELTVRSAWDGSLMTNAIKAYPREARMWLLTEVAKLVKDIDANKTLSSDEEIRFCCRSIVADFPSLRVEEIRVAFDMIRKGEFGKLYERLKTGEILECLRRYEGEWRAEMLEQRCAEERNKHFEQPTGKLEPLNLAQLVPDVLPQWKGTGTGTQIRKKLDKLLPKSAELGK